MKGGCRSGPLEELPTTPSGNGFVGPLRQAEEISLCLPFRSMRRAVHVFWHRLCMAARLSERVIFRQQAMDLGSRRLQFQACRATNSGLAGRSSIYAPFASNSATAHPPRFGTAATGGRLSAC